MLGGGDGDGGIVDPTSSFVPLEAMELFNFVRANSPQSAAALLLLESVDVREKLEAYALLSAECCASKAQQNRVGELLRERPRAQQQPPGRRLLDVAFADLEAADRAVRLAAARLICHAAYENLPNQDSIAQLANGFSVGWVHVFAVPQSFQTQYAADCAAAGRAPSPRGLREFLRAIVSNSYAPVYSLVSSYYSGGCRAFLPLTWQFPPPAAAPAAPTVSTHHSAPDSAMVPDPACHLVGFYLVPRQAQLPEQDDFYADSLLGAMDADDVGRIHRVHRAFAAAADSPQSDSVGARGGQGWVLKSALLRALQTDTDLQWVLGDSEEHEPAPSDSGDVESVCQYFDRREEVPPDGISTAAAADFEDPTALVWSQVLAYCCMQINTQKLRAAFGAETLSTLADMFRGLALSFASLPPPGSHGRALLPPARKVHSGTYVWEAALVGAILNHHALPGALKRHVASFQHGLYQSDPPRSMASESARASRDREYLREPWRRLLPFRLDQLQPVSWCLFLTQWRVAADTFRALESPQRRMTTVCSVSTIRRSMISMDSRSFVDLEDLRQELPNVARSQRQLDVGATARRISEESEAEPEDMLNEGAGSWNPSSLLRSAAWRNPPELHQDTESSLAHYLKLFHRMQHSPADLDKLSALQILEKQAAATKLHESVAINKKRLADAAKRKRLEIEERLRGEEEKREELERKKAEVRSSVQQKQTSRHDMALRRRQQQQARDEERQRATMAQIEEEQREYRRLVEAKLQQQQQQQQAKKRAPQDDDAASHLSKSKAVAMPPAAGGAAASRRPGSARRPLSARTPTAPPEILRQRAQIYGDVVSKIYLAEAARHPQPPPLAAAPPHLARRFTSFRKQSALAGAADTDLPHQPQPLSPTAPTANGKLEWRLHTGSSSSSSSANSTSQVLARELGSADLKVDAISTACTTLVMRNAALAVSERVAIPAVPPPARVDSRVPAYAIAAQYSALDTQHKQKFRERFHLKGMSHRLSYTVLKQFTKIVRRDTAWEEFHHVAASASGERGAGDCIRHADFVHVAQQLGIALPAKKLLAIARRLDDKKNGFVEWERFYAWWSAHYEDALAPSRV